MSIFSKIIDGAKKLTLKKVAGVALPIVTGGLFTIPGVAKGAVDLGKKIGAALGKASGQKQNSSGVGSEAVGAAVESYATAREETVSSGTAVNTGALERGVLKVFLGSPAAKVAVGVAAAALAWRFMGPRRRRY